MGGGVEGGIKEEGLWGHKLIQVTQQNFKGHEDKILRGLPQPSYRAVVFGSCCQLPNLTLKLIVVFLKYS